MGTRGNDLYEGAGYVGTSGSKLACTSVLKDALTTSAGNLFQKVTASTMNACWQPGFDVLVGASLRRDCVALGGSDE